MTLPADKWEEIEPCVYQLRAYTSEQIEMLNRRQTELINAALGIPLSPASANEGMASPHPSTEGK